ncbi:methionyl-tRNA formyltransferase [Candidatus Peregrinibacteria bacterium CG10_big_fil_rev_8_21_14_0_10_36_19]|nr:MAG: methionyl-tRNA formyltransferase [Candidatus Peregrinibacteria bacterium CG10_big_fil_rev_8_21_14_0_10_36_19]
MKIAYFGTPEFAVPILETLISKDNIEIVAVITQPDKKFGRKQETISPAVKISAQKFNLPVFQPENSQELNKITKNLKVDFFVVVAFGMIFNQETLNIPKYGCINIHPSLLPKYRGASPLHEAILHGDQETGVSIMEMSAKMDAGPLYICQRLKINESDDINTLTIKTSLLASQLLPETLSDIMEGYLTSVPQSKTNISYCKKIKKEDGEIHKNKSAKEIINMYRAYKEWPEIYTIQNDKKIKLLEIEISDYQDQAGTLVKHGKELFLGTKTKSIKINKIQPEGKNPMDAQSFINGNQALFK